MYKFLYIIVFLFISIPAMSQKFPFSQKWKDVQVQINEGKTKSITPLLNEIYLASKNENQADDLIKALVYKSNIAIQTSDDENIAIQTRDEILQEINQSSGIQQAILQSILAQLYFDYYQDNFYRIQGRTNLAINESSDFRTWTTSMFLQEVDSLLQSSLKNKKNLLNTPPNEIALLLTPNDQYRFLQPSLYDILVRKTINIYNNDRFKAQEFDQVVRNQRLESHYTDVIQVRKSDKDKSAVIQYNIEYLQYLNETSANYEILSALKDLDEQYRTHPWSTNILATQAAYLRDENRFKEAVEVSKIAQIRFPNTFGAQRASAIQNDIEYPSLHFTSDANFMVNQYNPLNITHKNIDRIYYQVYELNNQQFAKNLNGFRFDYNHKKLKISGNLVLEDSIQLKSFDDYELKKTHIAFPPLPEGNYVILISENNQFSGEIKHHLSQAIITSTKIDLATRRLSENDSVKTQIQLVDKLTGLPFSNQNISLLHSFNDAEFKKIKTLKTDNFGRVFIIAHEKNYRNAYAVQVSDEKALLRVHPYHYRAKQNDDDWDNNLKIFTDRAIYRPGQTVYFKGILYQTKGKENRIVRNKKLSLILEDVNAKEIATLDLVSNEYGSVHGEFVLPTSGLTGEFNISDDWSDNSYYSFRVEEYKRPRFQVKLDSLKSIYQINEKVKIEGKASTFSGANVSNAKVVYRVFRKVFQPYGWWWPPSNPAEVDMISGETITAEDGSFHFDFTALPVENEAIGKRAYNYRIIVNVTDIAGETQILEESVRIGDIPLQINLLGKDKVTTDEFHAIKISAKNLNGLETEASGSFQITKIHKMDRVLRNEQFSVDYELLNEQEFIIKLPYIAYNNNHLIENRKRGKIILSQKWNTMNSDSIRWNQKIPVGIYELKAISIYKNDTIEDVKIVEVYNPKIATNQNTFFDFSINKNSFQPGDIAEITLVSDADSANVLVEFEVSGNIIKREILNLNNSQTLEFPILEEYRGGVFVHVYFNKFNESISRIIPIEVPYDNKKLEFTVATLRNKLQPGQNETWTLTIEDKKGDAFLVEVLASMYDKSLDQFVANPYSFSVYSNSRSQIDSWSTLNQTYFSNLHYRDRISEPNLIFENLNLFGLSLNEFMRFKTLNALKSPAPVAMQEERVAEDASLAGESAGLANRDGQPGASESFDSNADANEDIKTKAEENTYVDLTEVQARKKLQETAFFFPNLKTDKEGNLKIEFTSPESLTQWNFQAVAHTQDLKIGSFQTEVVTQKELMVVPNAPRFLREGDLLTFKTQVMNLSDKHLSGKAQLFLFDAFSMQPIEAKFEMTDVEQDFSVKSGGNTSLSWRLKIPYIDDVQSVVYKVIASTGDFSDGEENALPILTNRMLVTESMPIHIRENQSKTFTFDKLVTTTSETRDNFLLTLEMTTNPIWYAVMALPHLREYPYASSEQIFARLYGNLISQSIVNSNPKIKAVFDDWNRKGELISPLEKNEELKNILLEETPWLRDAQNESEQMKRIAVLFDLNQMRNELQNTFRNLAQKQSSNGGFPWFEGGKENFYITTHIVAGFGHLKTMEVNKNANILIDLESIPAKAIQFLDKEMEFRWDKFLSDKQRYHLSGYDGLYWLYARSYFLQNHPLSAKLQKAKDYFLDQLEKDRFNQNLKTQALLSLSLHRFGDTEKAKEVIFSIKDRAVESEEMGMYWKENVSGYSWFQAPVETQALIIEAFDEITPEDIQSVENMKVWLLKNKQTNQWKSTKATTEAVYALINTGKDWANAEKGVSVKMDNEVWLSDEVSPSRDQQQGSGYVKESWHKSEITPEKGIIEVSKTSPGVAWGALHWQYFENLDKITQANTNVRFKKQLFIQKNTSQGPQLFEISTETPITIGDLVKVRLEIQTDRAMEFVHIKDMRASGFEPVNVLSSFKIQDGLGYYESTRDAATNFFIDFLPKGVYVFEYDLRANNAGTFSNGITQLQNMYAPEFSAQSEGIQVHILE